MTLHSILGGSRIRKKKSPAKPSGWTSSLPRTKTLASSSSKLTFERDEDDDGFGFAHDNRERERGNPPLTTLPPRDLPFASSSGLSLMTAHAYSLARMFDPLPERASGLSPAKIAGVLTFRDALPGLVSAGHLRVLLPSPTAAERELAGLVAEGKVRRIIIPHRDGIGELAVTTAALEGMVESSRWLEKRVKEGFVTWLKGNPAALALEEGDALLRAEEVDDLVRAGFLTAAVGGHGANTGVYARPAERHALLSLEAVARAAAGSVAAVGGDGAVHRAGGTGVKGTGAGKVRGRFSLSVPGAGVFLKLVAGGLEHLTGLLERTPHRSMPESDLREKWDGGVVGDSQAALAKKTRGEFVGILPGRTKKWKDLHGLAFDWILREAVGAGVVEVFETHSVGLGVRLV